MSSKMMQKKELKLHGFISLEEIALEYLEKRKKETLESIDRLQKGTHIGSGIRFREGELSMIKEMMRFLK